jgi:hypothetical protein
MIQMGRKHDKVETIHIMSGLEHTLMMMPKYYPASRCGLHKNKKKYNRKDQKIAFRKMMEKGDY